MSFSRDCYVFEDSINLYKLKISVSHIFLSSFKSIKLKKLSLIFCRLNEMNFSTILQYKLKSIEYLKPLNIILIILNNLYS